VSNKRANLVDEGFDVALRASIKLGDSTLVARKLGDLELHLYASPKYLEQRGAPVTPTDLVNHHNVIFRGQASFRGDASPGGAPELSRTWLLAGPSGETSVTLRGRIGGDDLSFVRAMLVAGAGIGLLPQLNCASDEASGRLVRVLPGYHARGASLYVVYPSKKHVPARVTAFRDVVVDAFSAWAARAS
ncbi:MAG TPA: substrate binding domain-containing protein, partial [Polyangiaceae bacterium]|nr:substrate binding domain-containing protein [Polyangiaceae bacterium]